MNRLLLGFLVLVFIYLFFNKEFEPTQEEIQKLTYVDKTKSIQDFPFPQISHQFQKLSKGELPQPLNNLNELLPNNESSLDIVRDTPQRMDKKRINRK